MNEAIFDVGNVTTHMIDYIYSLKVHLGLLHPGMYINGADIFQAQPKIAV
jgi:hypothetical protein